MVGSSWFPGTGGFGPAGRVIGFVLHNRGWEGEKWSSGVVEKGSRGEEKMRSGEVIGFVLHNGGIPARRDRARTGIGFVSAYLGHGKAGEAPAVRELGSFCVFWFVVCGW